LGMHIIDGRGRKSIKYDNHQFAIHITRSGIAGAG